MKHIRLSAEQQSLRAEIANYNPVNTSPVPLDNPNFHKASQAAGALAHPSGTPLCLPLALLPPV